MALRLANKINRNIIQNFGKVLYTGKVETIATTAVRNINEETRTKDVNVQKSQVYPPPTHIPSMMSPITNSTNDQIESEKNVQMHKLQPSMLPEYYKHTIDVQHATYPKPPEMEPPKPLTQYRQFEKSTTYKSVKLPLKQTRLAGPFPDPVKVMPSDTMSDQEKAEQKTAEARIVKGDTSSSPKMVNFSTQQRSYSYGGTIGPDDKKCRKKAPKKNCPSLKGPCEPPESKSCDRDYPFKDCKKKDAPYPAYSEFCHTIPDEHPSECKICPWKPSEHPTFKPNKKRYHTSAIAFCPRKRLHEKRQLKTDLKNSWVEEGKWKKETLLEPRIDINNFSNIEPLSSVNSPSLYLDGNKPCKRPNINRCPPGTSKKDRKRKKGKKGKKGKKMKKSKGGKKSKKQKKRSRKPKKKALPLSSDRSWITLVDTESIKEFPNLFNNGPYLLAGKKKRKGKKKEKYPTVRKGKCKKVPSGSCKIKNKPAEGVPGRCPKPKRKKLIGDCPEERSRCKDTAPLAIPSVEYLLDGKKKKKGGKSKKSEKPKKCPQIEKGRCQDDDDDKPCGPKTKGGTKRCPSDLLVKRRRKAKRPIKKAQGIIIPEMIPSTSKNSDMCLGKK
ncbi:hypothetical protein ILUMI_05407 [Ignelater luminosus]|uniref:Uncharacterized protein n=1 Tax=Ignelater luminosus TaxID=2038154 RepID=A0A8K0GGE0_IGNLU|nr:hypothetical protein ILUMI_05407 [Ignelater luminosus]